MNSTVINPLKGEIWSVNFEPAKGQEIQKTRPALVINENAIGQLNQRIVVPITEWKGKYKEWVWMIEIRKSQKNGLTKDSSADSSQIRSVSIQRFSKKYGEVTLKQLENVLAGVVICIGYDCPACTIKNNLP